MTNLGLALSAMQLVRNIRNDKMAKEIGISSSTLSRIKKGTMPDAEGFVKIIKWLAQNRKGVVFAHKTYFGLASRITGKQ